MNRIGNLVVPNDNYCKFEDWLTPILDTMLEEQKATGEVWTPSSFIRRLGKEINNEESVYYWAYKVSSRHNATSDEPDDLYLPYRIIYQSSVLL